MRRKSDRMANGAFDAEPNLGTIARAVWANKRRIIGPTLVIAAAAFIVVNLMTPKFKSEARLLVEGRENIFLRADAEKTLTDRAVVDQEAVTSQVQLVLSRDLGREVVQKLKLDEIPEFTAASELSPSAVLRAIGLGKDPSSMSVEERVLAAYFERLSAFPIDKSRVIAIEFKSADPDLAARAANVIAESYLTLQQVVKQDQARAAGQWLSGELEKLRGKVSEAEAKVEDFRAKSNLFMGANNTTLSNIQLGEVSTQVSQLRAQKADAEAKAKLIRETLRSGQSIESSEIVNSELIRRLAEQRITLRTQLAEQSSTLLPQHPRIRELRAQIADLETQIRQEGERLVRTLEADSKVADARLSSLNSSLDQLKRQAASTSDQDVQLRALERESKAQRDLFESYLAKYREASARESIDTVPSDARIISRAIVSNIASYPKKLPIVLIATLATLMISSGFIAGSELLRITAPGALSRVAGSRREPEEFAAPIPVPAAATVAVAPTPTPAPAFAFAPAPPAIPEFAAPPVAPPTWHAALAAPVTEIETVANDLRAAGERARKITLIGVGQGESATLTALTLARLLARGAKVVLVELSISSPTVGAISHDPMAPGLSDLMLGTASFSEIISRDRLSQVHLVGAGRASKDRSLLQSPRLALAIDALLQAYDHVVLDAGTAADLPAALLSSNAHAVVIPDPSMGTDTRALMSEQLRATGFLGVTMLSGPADPIAAEAGPEVAAA